MDTMSKTKNDFLLKLAHYKQLIDGDIAEYGESFLAETCEAFGPRSAVAADAFVQILNRGGKRIRGALLMAAYELAGGTDQAAVVMAARAVEMMHAYILMIDDIQDKSEVRRGGPSAHILLKKQHEAESLSGDAAHYGISLALNGALIGAHQAQTVLCRLPVTSEVRLEMLEVMNTTMTITAHGQTNDIYNEVLPRVSQREIVNVLNWKTAQYTFVSPLKMGVILAGGNLEKYQAVFSYGEAAGFAFQITDDIIGVFGDQKQTGKSAMDDVKEGKRTLLSVYAIEHADEVGARFLEQQLGNENIDQEEFEQVKEIIRNSGALAYAENKADDYIQQARQSLAELQEADHKEVISFLEGLAEALKGRGA